MLTKLMYWDDTTIKDHIPMSFPPTKLPAPPVQEMHSVQVRYIPSIAAKMIGRFWNLPRPPLLWHFGVLMPPADCWR